MTATEPQLKDGRIVGIAGPVVDVEFPPGHLPEINSQLEFDVTVAGGQLRTTPNIATSAAGSVLTLSPNTTLSNVELTPELTSQWLGYATPLLANGASAATS